MNVKQLIEKIEALPAENYKYRPYIDKKVVLALVRQLDEPQPLKLKDIISRMKQLFPLSRSEWIDEILKEFGEEFGSIKYRSGYEQGKLEGAWVGNQLKDADKIRQELNKPVIPQFVADWIEESKKHCKNVVEFFKYKYPNTEMIKWIESEKRFDLIARAWLDGYEVEKEPKYTVRVKGVNEECEYLFFGELSNTWKFRSLGSFGELKKHHTRKELEEANFGWVFDCEGIEVEEVTE